jgi:hypothetical protein
MMGFLIFAPKLSAWRFPWPAFPALTRFVSRHGVSSRDDFMIVRGSTRLSFIAPNLNTNRAS